MMTRNPDAIEAGMLTTLLLGCLHLPCSRGGTSICPFLSTIEVSVGFTVPDGRHLQNSAGAGWLACG